MPKTSRTKRTADEIADMATRGENVSACFTNKFVVVRPIHRVLARALTDEQGGKLRPGGKNKQS
jgi:hypothetical protein